VEVLARALEVTARGVGVTARALEVTARAVGMTARAVVGLEQHAAYAHPRDDAASCRVALFREAPWKMREGSLKWKPKEGQT
jgi:hypothetical protein